MEQRYKKRVNVSLPPRLNQALELYCKERGVAKSDLMALLLLYCFSTIDDFQISEEMKMLIGEISEEDLFSKHSPFESNALFVPELQDFWGEICRRQKEIIGLMYDE